MSVSSELLSQILSGFKLHFGLIKFITSGSFKTLNHSSLFEVTLFGLLFLSLPFGYRHAAFLYWVWDRNGSLEALSHGPELEWYRPNGVCS